MLVIQLIGSFNMKVTAVKTPIFKEKDNLINFINNQIHSLEEGDIVVVTSKIVALSQGRVGEIKDKEKLSSLFKELVLKN